MNGNVISEIEYQPSIVGRIARLIIPMLRIALPSKLYMLVYDFLYNTYKETLKRSYIAQVFFARLSGNPQKILRANLTYKLLPFTMGTRRALENAFDVVALIESRNIEGALVECGVAEGGTAAMLALASLELGKTPREKWYFDSYEGLPAPTEEDYDMGKTGHFIRPLPPGSCLGTLEQVEELMFNNLKLNKEEVHLIKGWFQDSVPAHKDKIDKIAILRLDGDWYESTKIPLENLYPKVQQGGAVIIDDYCTCFGSRKATDEYRQNHNITTPLIPDGRGGVWFEKAS